MTEYERIREQALLTDGELLDLIIQWRRKANETNPPQDPDVAVLAMAVRQAQLDKALKTEGIEIRADDQSLPNELKIETNDRNLIKWLKTQKQYLDLIWNMALNNMLKAGFVKVISKTAKEKE